MKHCACFPPASFGWPRIYLGIAGAKDQHGRHNSYSRQYARAEGLDPITSRDHAVSIVAAGLHSNPKYWSDLYAFKPERFFGEWNRDAFIPFSAGSRVCLGRRFFETEATAILALLISRYRVTIKEEPQFAHETFEQKKARVLKTKHALSLTPVRVPLVFTRRD